MPQGHELLVERVPVLVARPLELVHGVVMGALLRQGAALGVLQLLTKGVPLALSVAELALSRIHGRPALLGPAL